MRPLTSSLALKPKDDSRRGHFDSAALVLLGMLMEGDKHGYEIKQVVDSRLSRLTDISSGTIYYTLKKLEKKRLVTRTRMREGNRPERRVYTITDEGKEVFQELLAQSFRQPDDTFYPFDIGFYFLRFGDLEQVLEAVEEKRENLQEFLAAIAVLEEENPGRWPFAYRALAERGRALAAANMQWYADVAEELKDRIERNKAKQAAGATAQEDETETPKEAMS